MLKSSRRQARLTNKTRLSVSRGELDGSEVVILEDEYSKGNLNQDGVEKGEDQEHHLQAAISAAAIRAAATRSGSGSGGGTGSNGGSPAPTSAGGTPAVGGGNARSSTTNLKPPPPIEEKAYHIPTPDATGIVANYAALYPRSQWQDPSAYVRFSDTVEETSAGPSGLGFGYTLDERDDEWLRDNNRMARGEGTSASAAGTPNGGRAKGKEKEEIVVPAMTEDEFELVMGLMERWTDEKYPTLHTDISRIPALSDMESFFSHPLPMTYFPSYSVPPAVPPPGILCRMAKTVYPHWRERRIAAGGKNIIPQLNYDESNDGDPYVCFRRREAKPVRKTRRTDSQSVDRLALLQAELIKAGQLAADTLARERRKLDLVLVEREAWEAKLRLIDAKRKYPAFPLKPDEEELLFRTGIGSTKKQRLTDPVQAREEKVSKTARKRESLAGRDSVSATGSPAPGEPKEKREDRPPPMEALKERMANIQMQIERDVARKREGDYQWEDQTDVAYQPLPIPAQARMFRPLLPEPSSASGSLAGGGGPSSPPTSSSARTSTTFRLRRGRGGILRVDRHVEHRPRPSHRGYRPSTRSDGGTTEALVNDLFPNSYFGHASEHPLRPVESDDDDDASDAMDGVVDLQPSLYAHRPRHTPDEIDYGRRVSERWRYDAEFGVVGAGMGMRGLEEEERVVVDEYEERHLRVRLGLYQEGDLQILSTDPTHLLAAQKAALEPPERPPPVILVRPAPPPPAPVPPLSQMPNMRRVPSNGPGLPRPNGLNGGSPNLGPAQIPSMMAASSPLANGIERSASTEGGGMAKPVNGSHLNGGGGQQQQQQQKRPLGPPGPGAGGGGGGNYPGIPTGGGPPNANFLAWQNKVPGGGANLGFVRAPTPNNGVGGVGVPLVGMGSPQVRSASIPSPIPAHNSPIPSAHMSPHQQIQQIQHVGGSG